MCHSECPKFHVKNLNFTTEITLYYATSKLHTEYYVVEGGKREPIAKRTKGTNQPSTGVALSLYYTVFQITVRFLYSHKIYLLCTVGGPL